MKVIVNWGERNTSAKYKVKAKDVAEAYKFFQARKEAGTFEWRVPWKPTSVAQNKVTEVTLSPWFRITMPTWPAYRDQPQNVKDNWDAMWKDLFAHEKEHLRIFESGFPKLVDELEALGPATRADVKPLIQKAAQAIIKAQEAFDRKTENGKTTITPLKIP